MLATLETNLGISRLELDRLLGLSNTELKTDARYNALLKNIDAATLNGTIKEAKRVLADGIPPIVEQMQAKHNLDHFPLTAFMLSSWIIGYLSYADEVWNLPQTHANVPVPIIREVIPHVNAIFAQMNEGAEAWQKAFAILVIPLISSKRG